MKNNTPEEYLKLDEQMLLDAEEGMAGEALRFWESDEYFVCLGRACKLEENVNVEACERDGIKILRRISGGGTVLQGPGCLNYSLVLSYDSDPSYRNINESYKTILNKIVGAPLVGALSEDHQKLDIQIAGVSDLTLNGKKFSGNAQARKKKYFLHHGSILYNFDLKKIPIYLKHPPKEPEYRKNRPHEDFLCNILLSKHDIKSRISEKLCATT